MNTHPVFAGTSTHAFPVTDRAAFTAALGDIPFTSPIRVHDTDDGRISLSENTEMGTWPSIDLDALAERDDPMACLPGAFADMPLDDFDGEGLPVLLDLVARFLPDGEHAVFTSLIEREGDARQWVALTVVDSLGRVSEVDMGDLVSLAVARLA